MDKKYNLKFGNFCESLAEDFLERKGYKILARNFERPWGEADIVAEKEESIIFIEVKSYLGKAPEGFEPEKRVSHLKITKLKKIAQTFIQLYGFQERSWQIDIVSVHVDRERGVAKFRHFKNITA